jgi:hypothetical protein
MSARPRGGRSGSGASARPQQPRGKKARGDQRSEDRARRLLFGGAIPLVAGIAIVATGPSDVGMLSVLVGLGFIIFGIHTFGRLGAPEPQG